MKNLQVMSWGLALAALTACVNLDEQLVGTVTTTYFTTPAGLEAAVDGDYATVRARVVTKQRGDIPVDARMIRRGDRWLIYGIAVENISLIANYRAQFDRIIRSATYQDLVTRLKTKREEFLQEARPGSS